MTRDEFWFWFGVWTSILMLVVAGAINFTGAIPDAWVPVVTKWCAIFAAANNAILTAAKFRGYLSAKAAAIVPDASTVAKILIAAFVLSMFLANGSAQAQGLKKPQITGDFAADAKANLGIGGTTGSVLTGNPSKDLIALYGKLQTVSLIDLKYALNIANKKNNKAAGQCWTAIITQIEQDQSANLDANGQPLPTPDPHLFTDVERLSDVINSLGPNSDLMVGCGSFANQAKMNVLQLVSTILAGGAGIAAIAP